MQDALESKIATLFDLLHQSGSLTLLLQNPFSTDKTTDRRASSFNNRNPRPQTASVYPISSSITSEGQQQQQDHTPLDPQFTLTNAPAVRGK